MTEDQRYLLENVGATLKLLREQAGLTQRQAAKKADSTQARISDLENGKAPMLVTTLQHWAKIYGYEMELHFVPIEEEEDAGE